MYMCKFKLANNMAYNGLFGSDKIFYYNIKCVGADPFGFPTLVRPWDDGSNSMANAKRRLRAGFEFFTKLGVPYWTFHDRYDISRQVNLT